MSNSNASRPNSQQKKTGIAIISDPIKFKKPTINEIRNDEQMKTNFANEPEQTFKPPSINAMRNLSPPENFIKPSLSDMRNANIHSNVEAAFIKPTKSDMQNVHVEFKVKEEPHYKPYTVEEYRELQQMDEYNNRGGLGPSFDDEWERKREMRTRVMQFAQKAKEENKVILPKRNKPRQEPKKGPSKHDKMKEYATKIPKPKAQPKNDVKPKKIVKPVEAKYDINAELERHYHFVQRVDLLRKSLSQYID